MKNHATILLLFLVSLSNCGSDKEKTNCPIKLTAHLGGINWLMPTVMRADDSLYSTFLDTATILFISTTIENVSNDTISLLSWSYHYENTFLTDDTANFIIHSRQDYYGDTPIFIYLLPGQKTDRYIMLRQKSKTFLPDKKRVRIGMQYFTLKKGQRPNNAYIEFFDKTNKKVVIWSNELHLDRLFKEIYSN